MYVYTHQILIHCKPLYLGHKSALTLLAICFLCQYIPCIMVLRDVSGTLGALSQVSNAEELCCFLGQYFCIYKSPLMYLQNKISFVYMVHVSFQTPT